MQGFETDRTLSAQEWRGLIFAAGGALIVGVGLGVLIGRLLAAPAGPPPASAAILPDVSALPAMTAAAPAIATDEDRDEPAAPPVTAPPPAPPPLVPRAVTPPSPAAQKADPLPEQIVAAPRVEAGRRPERPAPARRPETKRAAKRAANPVAKPAPADPGPPPGGPRWVVQLGAFQSSDHANLLVNTLAAHGQAAHVTYARNAAGQGWFYVQTPPYRSAAAAKGAAKGLAAREHLPTYLVKLPDAG